MKKRALMLAVLVVIGTTSLFAFGIGAQGGYSIGPNGLGGAALTFKLDNIPWVFAADGIFTQNYVAIGGTADMWLANKPLAKPINYYYGWGLAGNFGLGNNFTFGVYARALGGLNVFLIDGFLELYLQAAWQPGIQISSGGVRFIPVNFPVAAGFRFWINK